MEQGLPDGVIVVRHERHDDARGDFTEVFRKSWSPECEFLQWNLVRSKPDTVRGVHLHLEHEDYLMVVSGELHLGLKDLRETSASYGRSSGLVLRAEEPLAVCIPVGVAHGFFFPKAAIHLYAVSRYWAPHDSLSCHWSDSALEFGWHTTTPRLSSKDGDAGSFAEMAATFRASLRALPV